MFERLCAVCGSPLPPEHSKYCSKACYISASPTMRSDLVCESCGKTFSGHIRSTRCPDCRASHVRLLAHANKQRLRAEATRKIGSVDYCAVCGQLFTVSSGSQKYCPVCAPDAITRRIRERTRKNAAALKAQNALDTSPDGVL